MRRSAMNKFAWTFFVGLPLLTFGFHLLLARDSQPIPSNVIVGLVGGLFAMFVAFPLLRFSSIASFHKGNAAISHPQTFEFSSGGLTTRGPLHSSHFDWAAVTRIVETKEEFLFYISRTTAQFLPKESLCSQELSQLRSSLNEWLPERVSLLADMGSSRRSST